ncbi:hypothetical protein HY634_01295 [Candidatus Uhrbacteria bacterium]|nr:hypothetical protein [Candidatus Uhrbacteria bacterium]
MSWLFWFIFALIYSVAAAIVGSAYAWLTGASGPRFDEAAPLAGLLGPILIMVMVGVRKVAMDTGRMRISIARAIYHTLLVAFAAPMLCFGASLGLDALGAPLVARLLKGFSYWSIPLVFVTAACYGLWRVTRQFDRAQNEPGGPGATPPSGSSGPGTRQATAQRAETDGSSQGSGMRMVACFSSRGTPFRLVPRSES